jgi:hypothetical protein
MRPCSLQILRFLTVIEVFDFDLFRFLWLITAGNWRQHYLSMETCLTQTADSLFFMHDGLQQACAPVYDVRFATEALRTGSRLF